MPFFKFIRESSLSGRIGFGIILLNLGVCLLVPIIAPYNESAVVGDVWELWSSRFPLGTDHLGRDMLTRLFYGARNTISIAFLITSLAFTLGILFGFLAAVIGGWVDQLLSRVVDIIMAFPTLIFALIVLSILGTSIPVLIGVISLLSSTRVYRLSRAIAMDIRVMDFVEVARLRGEGLYWIMSQEILPNSVAPLLAEFGLRFCFVFLFISSLSFLGLGIQPPTADWGGMVRENAGAITFGIIAPLLPAAAIAFLTVGVNLVVDWLLHRSAGQVHEGL
jgi:peptide/nickel transport system permease protein